MAGVMPAVPRLRRGHPLAQGLVAAWPFFNGSGDKLSEIGGSKSTGSLIASPTWGNGPQGHIITLNGTSQYIDCGTSPVLQLQPPFTLVAWINPAALPASQAGIVANTNYVNGQYTGYQLILGSAGQLYFQIGDNSGSHSSGTRKTWATANGLIAINNWYRIAATMTAAQLVTTSSTLTVFINGKANNCTNSDGSSATTIGYDSTNTVRIGAFDDFSAGAVKWFLQSGVYDVRLYNGVAWNQEIAALDYASFYEEYKPKRLIFLGANAAGGSSGSLGLVTETGTLLPITRVKSRTLGLLTESDGPLSMTRSKALQLGLPVEPDSTFTLGRLKTRSLGLVTETDAVSALVRSKARSISIITEVDTSQPVTRVKMRQLGLVGESDTPFGFGFAASGQIGLATETNSALPMGRVKTKTLGLLTETDTATPVVRVKVRSISLLTESGVVEALSRAKSRSLGLLTETDTVLSLFFKVNPGYVMLELIVDDVTLQLIQSGDVTLELINT